MSDANRRELAALVEELTLDLDEWDTGDATNQALFWQHFFRLRSLVNTIDRELPLHDPVPA